MFLEQGIKPGNKFWKYVIGFLFVIATVILGRMLIRLVIFLTSLQTTDQLPEGANESLGYLPPNVTLLLLGVRFAITIFILFLIVKYLHKQTWLSVISARPKIDWKRVLFAFGVSALFWICVETLYIILVPENKVLNFQLKPFLIYAFVTLIVVSIKSFAEQYFFRGYLMQGFANLTGNRWSPLLIVAAINALLYTLHPEIGILGFLEMFSTLLLYTLFLGIITLMDEGTELAIGFHAANVFITQVFFTSDNTTLKTDALYILIETDSDTVNAETYLPYIIILPLFLFLFSKKYKWILWREKLTGKIHHTA